MICNAMNYSSMLYYANWVLGDSVESGAVKQILLNAIGMAPMGLGVPLLWPLVRKFGKERVMVIGCLLAALGSAVVLCAGDNMPLVLAGLLVKSVGGLPMYTASSFTADALDHVETRCGFRVDGMSASVSSALITVATGLCQSVLLGGLSLLGYIVPQSAAQVITQPQAVRNFLTGCFAGVSMVGYALCAWLIAQNKKAA